MEEPENILRCIEEYFMSLESGKDLAGFKVGITAGPTYEKIDPVRFVGNYSSGKMGFAIAEEFASRGAEVTLVTGPVALQTEHPAINRIDVESAREMLSAAEARFGDMDVCVFAAAVADYRPADTEDHKIKREKQEEIHLKMTRNPDIAATCASSKRPGQFFVGFALETDNEASNAESKLARKNLDMIVLNSLRDQGAGFRTDTNKVTIFTRDASKSFPLKSKREVARDIVDEITELSKKKSLR